MAARPIVMFPDPRLRTPAAAVASFDDALRALVDDLQDTLREARGIGITAPHIGVLQRVLVIRLEADAPVLTAVNPEVLWSDAALASNTEGSVSLPGVVEQVERPARVRVRYRDLDGAEQTVEADGLLAVCLQHEIDQLDGVFWTQRLSRLKRDRLMARYDKLRRRM